MALTKVILIDKNIGTNIIIKIRSCNLFPSSRSNEFLHWYDSLQNNTLEPLVFITARLPLGIFDAHKVILFVFFLRRRARGCSRYDDVACPIISTKVWEKQQECIRRIFIRFCAKYRSFQMPGAGITTPGYVLLDSLVSFIYRSCLTIAPRIMLLYCLRHRIIFLRYKIKPSGSIRNFIKFQSNSSTSLDIYRIFS